MEFSVPAIDRDRDPLTYIVESETLELLNYFDPVTFTFSWTPTYDDAGQYTITFTAEDPGGLTNSETITILVEHVNRPPVLNVIPTSSINETDVLDFKVTAEDPDGDLITFRVEGEKGKRYFNPDTQIFHWETTYDDAGSYPVRFIVEDEPGLDDSQDILINVANVDRLPVITEIYGQAIDPNDDPETPIEISKDEYNRLFFEIKATDEDGDEITYTIDNLPNQAAFSSTLGTFDWTPTADHLGDYTILLTARANGNSDSKRIHITVNDVPHDPEFLNLQTEWTINEGDTISFKVEYRDLDKEVVKLTVFGKYAILNGDIFTFQSDCDSVLREDGEFKTYSIMFYLEDVDGDKTNIVAQEVKITVMNVDRLPYFTSEIVDQEINIGEELIIDLAAQDDDGDPVMFNISNMPAGASFTNETGYFVWTPKLKNPGAENGTDIGEHSIKFEVESNGAVVSKTILLKVYGPRLEITSLTFQSTVEKGDSKDGTVSIRNTGNVPTGNFWLSWEVVVKGGTQVVYQPASIEINGLEENNSVSQDITIDTDKIGLGEYTLRVTADGDSGHGGPTISELDFEVVNPKYNLNLTIEPDVGGIVNKSPDLSLYELGTEVTLNAVPQDGWAFKNWVNEISDGLQETIGYNPYTLTMNSHKNITAYFEKVNLISDIAFISGRYNESGEICILEAATNDVERITTNDLVEVKPTWSPDGTKIFFEGIDRYQNHHIYYVNVINANKDVVTVTENDLNYSPSISPNGELIAFTTTRWGGLVVSIIGSDETEHDSSLLIKGLTDADEYAYNPVWAPDSSLIAYESRGQIWVVDLNGFNPHSPTGGKLNIANAKNPQWSSLIDSPKIVFESDGDIYAIEFIESDGDIYGDSRVVKVTTDENNQYNDHNPVWSGDGLKVAFISDRDGATEIYVVRDPGTLNEAETNLGVTRVTYIDGGEVTDLSWNADGWIVFTVEHNSRKDIYMVDENGQNLTRLTYNSASDSAPSWK